MSGIPLRTMADALASIEVEWFGETATVEVRPGRLTRELFQLADSDEPFEGVAEQVKALVARWEVLDDKGKELPVTDEVIAALPFGFIRSIVAAAIATVSAEGKA